MRFFLIDRVTEVVAGTRARGVKAVTLTDEVLHDHFPDHPLLPGTLLVEAMAQLGGYLLEVSQAAAEPRQGPPLRALLAQIDRARFREPVGPGSLVELETTIASHAGGAAQVDGRAHVEGREVASARVTFVLRHVESPRVHEQRRALYELWTRALPGGAVIP